jgi:hypothetical protein
MPARERAAPDEAEVIDRTTGEMTSAAAMKEQLGREIKGLREQLGWVEHDVRRAAAEQGFSLRTVAGLTDARDWLRDAVSSALGTDGGDEGPGQTAIFDAESHVAGEPGLDRHSA